MSQPAINDSGVDPVAHDKACDTMVAIKDSILAVIEHEDGRGRDTSALRAELLEVEEALTALQDAGIYIRYSELVSANQAAHDAFGAWMEANRREGHFTPFPVEIDNILHQEMIENVEPYGSSGGVIDGPKGPAVIHNEGAYIHVENAVGHIDHELASNI